MAGSLDFLINIQQKLSGGNVASQLADLEKKIKAEGTALAALERQMAKMQRGKSIDIDSYKQLQGAIDAKTGSIKGLQGQMIGLSEKTDESSGAVGGLGKALESMKAGPAAAAIAVLAIIATAIVVATYKLASFALAAADAHRSFLLILEGATGSDKAARGAASAIDRVAKNSALARSQIEEYGRALAVADLSGQLFAGTLQTLATVASVAGSEAANKIQEIVKKSKGLGHFQIESESLVGLGIEMGALAKSFGMSIAEMQAKMKAGSISIEDGLNKLNGLLQSRFAGVAAKQMLGFDVQVMKLHENLAGLFKDVKIEGFLTQLQGLLSFFDSSTASGKALKYTLTSMMSGFFTAAGMALPYVKALLTGLLIAGLNLYIALKPAIRAIGDALGIGTTTSADGLAAMVTIGKGIGYVMIFVVAVFATMFATMNAIIGAFTSFVPLGAMVIGAIVGSFGSLVSSASDALSGIKKLGGDVVDGVVAGILGGIGRAVAAITKLGSSMANAFTSVLQIHSPSRLFRAHARQVPAGAALGVEDGTDDVQGAVATMMAPPAIKGGTRRSSSKAGGSFGPLRINIYGRDAADIWAQLEEKVIALLDGVELSGPEPAGAT